MTTIHRHALTPFSADQMFALVDDIEAYPAFLQWCRSADVISRDIDVVTARLELAKGSVHKTFTTQNRLMPGKMIEMKLVEGPFRHLEGFWKFEALREDACKISLDLEFDFSSKMLSMVVGPVFSQVANTLVDAFCRRAEFIYAG
ncbi:MAG: type II toxin-antitoxin system RatA family toxin [Gammaproteobacteria bacterium]|nr:type II toxin-antitoxin system RatA family toxin [Gammaproteobacteria bacterium]